MTNTVTVRAYDRKKPAKKPDPFQETIEARRAVLLGRYAPVPKQEQSKLRRTLFWLGRIWR